MSNFLNKPISTLLSDTFSLFRGKNETKALSTSTSHMKKGQLAVDVFQTEDDIMIFAPIAGVKLDDVEVVVNEDLLTIRGMRSLDIDVPQRNYYAQECFWGEFSRSIVLPTAVNTAKIGATFNDGVLKIQIPKANKVKMQIIKVRSS